MIAREFFILKLLEGNDKSFNIPVYQREYSWGVNNCKTLLSDLKYVIDNNLPSHFFGSVVYSEKNLGGVSAHCIIDGQQRITTVTLLLLAIYNVLKRYEMKHPGFLQDREISLDKIENSYFYVDPYKNPKQLKLILTDFDLNHFNLLFESKDDKDVGLLTNVSALDEKSNIHKNFKFFFDDLSRNEIDRTIQLFEALKKLSIVNISLEHDDDPQLIFESINSKHMELHESDKIRNFLFMKVNYEDQKLLYQNYWKKISNNVENVSKLIRFYLVIKTNQYAPEKQLYYYFKQFVLANSEMTAEMILKEILVYSQYMQEMSQYNANSKDEFERSIFRLNKLDMSTIYPVLFVCFDKFKGNEISTKDMDDILSLIESYLVRIMFLKFNVGGLNKVFAFMPFEIARFVDQGYSFKEAVIQTFMSKTGNSRFPKNTEFKDAFKNYELYNAKPPFKKYVLERLSNFNNKEIIDVDDSIQSGKLTIEHIMPQHLTEEWEAYLGDSYETIHSKYLNTIGNLTLTAYNSEYSNSSFETKKTLPGIGFDCSNLYLNSYLKTCSEWKEKEIVERGDLLFERALKIWIYPAGYENSSNVPFNLNDPSTWSNIPITQFAKQAFDYMLTNNMLTLEEISFLKDKDESKRILGAYYAVLTTNRKPEGCKKSHWSTKEYKVNDETLYLSVEWFKEQFEKLSAFVKKKINL